MAELKSPVRYTPGVEQTDGDEQKTQAELNEQFTTILETTSKDYGHAVRSVHAKSHGIVTGELTVHDQLPPELAQGLFATAGTHAVLLRFSTNPGDILDDSISVPRGVAIKVFDVAGDRLPGAEGNTQDFVMANGPAFAAATPEQFLGNLKMLAKTTDKAEWAKKALSKVLQTAEAALELVGGESATLKTLGGAPNVHPLGETYWGQAPFRYGDYIAKFQLVPVSDNLTSITGNMINADGRPDAIREAMRETMIEADGVWELRVQLNRDLDSMDIEDASKPWDEEQSPFQTVATIRVPHQLAWSPERAQIVDDQLRFSVWTGLSAHQPLGAINRARRSAYQTSSDFRGRFNGCPIHEPQQAPALAG
ncbi:hypothetical protein GGR88_002014 [Sphingomonas jejuensis]|uniref:Catalase n=1 Tax=Sphingomonas jejuensis TaxID=904715 RepID=A0ABX0XMN7_9SPHN|nr:catalase family protein [Sphingomonas jejuensis]NJC34500.1 hypothetical protein [Sphingomonas jejuensis]